MVLRKFERILRQKAVDEVNKRFDDLVSGARYVHLRQNYQLTFGTPKQPLSDSENRIGTLVQETKRREKFLWKNPRYDEGGCDEYMMTPTIGILPGRTIREYKLWLDETCERLVKQASPSYYTEFLDMFFRTRKTEYENKIAMKRAEEMLTFWSGAYKELEAKELEDAQLGRPYRRLTILVGALFQKIGNYLVNTTQNEEERFDTPESLENKLEVMEHDNPSLRYVQSN